VFGPCDGAFAEYACGRDDAFVPKPSSVTVEQAAAIPTAGLTALQGVRDHGQAKPGHHVLVNGASGGVGTFAVQIAKAFGARVTGVCSTRNLDLVRSIGADHVIDYTQRSFTQSGERYDLIVDIAPRHSLSECRRALAPKGTYVLIGDSGGRWLGGLSRFLKVSALSPLVGQRLRAFIASPKHEDLVLLKELVEAGKLKPIIDRTYPLSQAPEAIGYVREGHARAKVVIVM